MQKVGRGYEPAHATTPDAVRQDVMTLRTRAAGCKTAAMTATKAPVADALSAAASWHARRTASRSSASGSKRTASACSGRPSSHRWRGQVVGGWGGILGAPGVDETSGGLGHRIGLHGSESGSPAGRRAPQVRCEPISPDPSSSPGVAANCACATMTRASGRTALSASKSGHRWSWLRTSRGCGWCWPRHWGEGHSCLHSMTDVGTIGLSRRG